MFGLPIQYNTTQNVRFTSENSLTQTEKDLRPQELNHDVVGLSVTFSHSQHLVQHTVQVGIHVTTRRVHIFKRREYNTFVWKFFDAIRLFVHTKMIKMPVKMDSFENAL